MKDYTSRLQVLEKHFCMKPIPTIDQFKKAWAEADPLSRSVLAALAESGDFDGWGKSWSRYMTAVEALRAFEIAAHNKDVTFTVPGNQAMETLLRAVADAVADDE